MRRRPRFAEPLAINQSARPCVRQKWTYKGGGASRGHGLALWWSTGQARPQALARLHNAREYEFVRARLPEGAPRSLAGLGGAEMACRSGAWAFFCLETAYLSNVPCPATALLHFSRRVLAVPAPGACLRACLARASLQSALTSFTGR